MDKGKCKNMYRRLIQQDLVCGLISNLDEKCIGYENCEDYEESED